MGCAAALATIDVIDAPGFLDDVRAKGARLTSALRAVAAEQPALGDVRGPGLMVGCEIVDAAAPARRGAGRSDHAPLRRSTDACCS